MMSIKRLYTIHDPEGTGQVGGTDRAATNKHLTNMAGKGSFWPTAEAWCLQKIWPKESIQDNWM